MNPNVPPTHPEAPRKTSGLAITAFVLSLLACVPLVPLIGTLLGVVALVRLGSRPHLGGKGLAIAAIPVGLALSFFTLSILAGIAIPNFIKFQQRSKAVEARTMVSALAEAELAHFNEHGVFLAAPPVPAEVPAGALVELPFDGPWELLGQAPTTGRFQYEVITGDLEDGSPAAEVNARGDLDGDGETSLYRILVTPEGAGELETEDEFE